MWLYLVFGRAVVVWMNCDVLMEEGGGMVLGGGFL